MVIENGRKLRSGDKFLNNKIKLQKNIILNLCRFITCVIDIITSWNIVFRIRRVIYIKFYILVIENGLKLRSGDKFLNNKIKLQKYIILNLCRFITCVIDIITSLNTIFRNRLAKMIKFHILVEVKWHNLRSEYQFEKRTFQGGLVISPRGDWWYLFGGTGDITFLKIS